MIKLNLHINKEDLFLFLLMIVFILFTYILADFIVMKDLDRNVELKNRYKFQQTLEKYIIQNQKDLQHKYTNLKNIENSLIHFEKGVNLKELVSNYSDVLTFDKRGESMVDKHINEERYVVSARFDSPKRFFQLLQDIHAKGIPLKVGYPVEFKKEGDKVIYSSELYLYRFAKSQ